jgi:hypothetical protein
MSSLGRALLDASESTDIVTAPLGVDPAIEAVDAPVPQPKYGPNHPPTNTAARQRWRRVAIAVKIAKKSPIRLSFEQFCSQLTELWGAAFTYIASCAWNGVFQKQNSITLAADYEEACGTGGFNQDADSSLRRCTTSEKVGLWGVTFFWGVVMYGMVYYLMAVIQKATRHTAQSDKAELYRKYMDLVVHACGFIIALAWSGAFHASGWQLTAHISCDQKILT